MSATLLFLLIGLVIAVVAVRVLTLPDITKALGMADILPYRRLIGDECETLTMADGGFMAMFEVSAEDREHFADAELGGMSDDFGRAVGALNDRFIVHFRDRRRKVTEYRKPTSYASVELQWLDDEASRQYLKGNKFTAARIMSLRFRSGQSQLDNAWSWFSTTVEALFGRKLGSGEEEEVRVPLEFALAEFEGALKPALNLLKGKARVRRLGIIREEVAGVMIERSEMLEEISYAISGRFRKIRVPRTLLGVNSLLAEPMRGGTEPRIGSDEIAIVVVKDTPGVTTPTILQELGQLSANYDLVVRWLPLSKTKSQELITKASSEWRRKINATLDMRALRMKRQTEKAQENIDDGIRFGMCSIVVVLRASTRAEVDAAAQRCVAILDDLYFPSFVSVATTENDFFGALPGIGHGQNRRYQIHEMNLMDLFSFHAPSSGREKWPASFIPRTTPPLLMAGAGKSQTGYGFIPQMGELMHLLGVGRSDSGKSTTIAHIGTSWLSRVPNSGWIAIDTGRSLYRPARWGDAPFIDLLGANSPGVNIYADLDDDQELPGEECTAVAGIVKLSCQVRGVEMTGKRAEAIDAAVIQMRASQPRNVRSHAGFVELLQDAEGVLKPALSLIGRRGLFGGTLDCEGDAFALSPFSVIDLGRAWSAEPALLIPLLASIFFKIRRAIHRMKLQSGSYDSPWLVSIDEAHRPMQTESGVKFIMEMLKEGRRDRLACHLWSNAAAEFATSRVLNDIKEQIATRLVARTSALVGDDDETVRVRGFYSALGYPPHGIGLLPTLNQHSWLLSQPDARELQELSWDLGPAQLAVFGKTSKADNDRLDETMAAYPDTWREMLLRREGVPDASIRRYLAFTEKARQKRSAALAVAS